MPTEAPVSRGDPVLDAALSEMNAEGVLDDSAPVDPTPTGDDTDLSAAPPPAADPTPAADPAAAPATPETPASTPAPAGAPEPPPDPLAGTEPLTYMVNGQSKTFDGIYVEKGVGAVIPADRLDAVSQRLAEREVYQAQAEQLWQQNQEFQRQTFQVRTDQKDTQGNDVMRTVNGAEAFQALREELAGRTAAALTIAEALFKAFPQEEYKAALDGLLKDADTQYRLATYKTREGVQQERVAHQSEQQIGQLRQEAMQTALGKLKSAYPQYTADDVKAAQVFLSSAPEVFFRSPQNAAEQQMGRVIIDYPRMEAWAADRAAFRTAQLARDAETQKRQDATLKANTFNAGQDKGRQPQKGNGTKPKPAAPIDDAPPKRSRAEQWDGPLHDALQELGIPR